MSNLPLDLIRYALAEDGADADVTTLCTVPMEQQTRATIITRQAGVIAGLAVAAATFCELDQRVSVDMAVEKGAGVPAGEGGGPIRGPAPLLVMAEHVALNFLGALPRTASHSAHRVRRL